MRWHSLSGFTFLFILLALCSLVFLRTFVESRPTECVVVFVVDSSNSQEKKPGVLCYIKNTDDFERPNDEILINNHYYDLNGKQYENQDEIVDSSIERPSNTLIVKKRSKTLSHSILSSSKLDRLKRPPMPFRFGSKIVIGSPRTIKIIE